MVKCQCGRFDCSVPLALAVINLNLNLLNSLQVQVTPRGK
jgi:hypothetical protein